jgi:Domain of unknown function (DUF4340)
MSVSNHLSTESGMARVRFLQVMLLVASFAVVFWLVLVEPPVDEVVVMPRSPLGIGGGARVVAVERTGAAGEFYLERRDGDWMMISPLVDLASKSMVREMLRSLEALEPVRILPAENLSDYGLDPPVSRLTVTSYSGQELTIHIGYAAPISGNIYAFWEGMGGIGLFAPRSLTNFTDVSVFKWREPELLPPSNCAIDSVHVHWASGETARVQRLGQEDWRFLDSNDLIADGLSCERTAAAFWRFAFNKFFDEPEAAQTLGLTAPAAEWIIFRCEQADTLRFGDRLSDNLMAVQLSGRAPGEVRDDLYEFLTGGRHMLTVCQPFEGEAEAISLVAIIGNGSGGRFWRRENRGWEVRELNADEVLAMTNPVSTDLAPPDMGDGWIPAGDPAFTGDLQNLFNNKGDSFLESVQSAKEFEGDDYRFLVWDESGRAQWALLSVDPAMASLSAQDAEKFGCTVLGSRFPTKPISFHSVPVYWRWLSRFSRELRH